MMLSIDTINNGLSVSLSQNKKIIDYELYTKPHEQCSMLFPIIESLFKRNSISYENISSLSVVNGPGSFTSIRIGIAAIQSLKIILKKTVIPVTTLQVMAFKFHQIALSNKNKSITVLLKAIGEMFYIQEFDLNHKPLSQAVMSDIKSIDFTNTNTLYVSDVEYIEENTLYHQPSSYDSAMLAENIIASNTTIEKVQPFYLRPYKIKIKNHKLF